MTITLTLDSYAITTELTPAAALALVAELPAEVGIRVRPDLEVRTYRGTCTVLEPHPPGYFGLAVAQAYDLWGDCPTCGGSGAVDPEYLAYLRGERPDPRD